MKKTRFLLLAALVVFALVLAACSQGETETVEVTREVEVTRIVEVPVEGEAAPAPAPTGERLQTVRDRGRLVCGSRTDLAGFGYLDESGANAGFDIDFCARHGLPTHSLTSTDSPTTTPWYRQSQRSRSSGRSGRLRGRRVCSLERGRARTSITNRRS